MIKHDIRLGLGQAVRVICVDPDTQMETEYTLRYNGNDLVYWGNDLVSAPFDKTIGV